MRNLPVYLDGATKRNAQVGCYTIQVMSLVWMIMALGVSALTVVVVLQLLDGESGRFSHRLTVSGVGLLMLLEGAALLFSSPHLSDPTRIIHGVAMIVAGAGIWSTAHQSLWRVFPSRRR
jgi:hypothetical protein